MRGAALSDTEPHSSRPGWAWYYILLYAVGTVLAAGGLIVMALQFALPEVRGLSGTGAAFTVIAAVVIAATTTHRKGDRVYRRVEDLRDEILANRAVAEDVRQLTAVHLETWAQAIRAEARDMFERGMKEMDGRFAALERPGRAAARTWRRRRRTPRPEDVDRFLSAIDSGDNVVPMPDPRKVKGDDAS